MVASFFQLCIGFEHAAGFLLGARECSIGNKLYFGPETEPLTQSMGGLLRQVALLLGQQTLDQFYSDVQGLMRWRVIDENQKLTGEPVCEVRQHIANASVKDIDAPDMQHIIAAAQHAKAKGAPPARTGVHSQDTHHVTGAIA